jgi:hypothetical protein
MSTLNRLDRYLLAHVPTAIVTLHKMGSETVEKRIQSAIKRIETVSKDHYDHVSVLSTYWASDDTGSDEDSSLFLKTISKLQNEKTTLDASTRILGDVETGLQLLSHVIELGQKMTGERQLFIVHYAGHAIAAATSDNLIITSKIAEGEFAGPQLNMSLIKETLKEMASTSPGLDVLLLLDCCCSSMAGRGKGHIGERMELMAATSTGGLSNSRKDGKTFTQHWCAAFDRFMELKKPFTCNDIESAINAHYDLVQCPATFVLREGWGVPITFLAHPHSTTSAGLNTQTVIAALHVEENPASDSLKKLVDYLENAPVPITVLASLPVSSTLLLLRVPVYLQEMLVLPQVALLLTDT